VEAEWDGEPNGLAVDPSGRIAIADYKQVAMTTFTSVSHGLIVLGDIDI
jgi:hypothetical protein